MSEYRALKPVDVPTRETVAFVTSNSAPQATVLEIGCGEGDVASVLLNREYRVIGVDANSELVAQARKRGIPAVWASWPDFDCGMVDTVAFTRSLHHIDSLSRAIHKAREVLTERGVLLVEDFSFDEANETTITWFLEALRSPDGRALILPVRGELVTDLLEADDVGAVWRNSHHHGLHTISTMTEAIAKEFVLRDTWTVPYLYRYLVPVLPATRQATEFLEGILEEESNLGRRGDIVLIGRRIFAAM